MGNVTDYIAPDVNEYFMTLQKNQNQLEESRCGAFSSPSSGSAMKQNLFSVRRNFLFSFAVDSQSFEHIHHVKTRQS